MHNQVQSTAVGRSSIRQVAAAMLLAVLLLAGGCAGNSPEDLYPVTGTVRVGDEVWKNGGTIQFEMINIGESGKAYTSRGIIEPDGRFRLSTFQEDGAPVGKHRVWVTPNSARMPDELGRNNVQLSPIPIKYMRPTQTDLEVEVKAEENDLEIVVPSKDQQ